MKKTRKKIKVRLITSDEEALFYLEQDTMTFPDNHLEVQQGMSWWKKYKEAAYSISVDGKPIGYLSFWPLEKETFVKLRDGAISEYDIDDENISPPKDKSFEEWWYIGGIFILEKYRNLKYTKTLIEQSTHQWLYNKKQKTIINICALAYTKEGALLLKKYEFNECSESNGIKTYLKTINTRESAEIIESIKSDEEIIISRKLESKLNKIAYITTKLIHSILNHNFVKEIYQHLNLEKVEIDICETFKNNSPLFCIRPDFIFSELGEIKICEINARFPLNGILAGQIKKEKISTTNGKEILDVLFKTFKNLDRNSKTYIISSDDKNIEIDYMLDYSEVREKFISIHHKDIKIKNNEIQHENKKIDQAILNISAKELKKLDKEIHQALSLIKIYNDPRMALIIHNRYTLSFLFETDKEKFKKFQNHFVNTYKKYQLALQQRKKVIFKENDTGKGLGVREASYDDKSSNGVFQPFLIRNQNDENNMRLPSKIKSNFIVGSFFATQTGSENINFFRSSKNEIVNIENKESLIHLIKIEK